MSMQSALTSKRKKGQRRVSVGFKNVPDKKKPMSKEQEEKHSRFLRLRHDHYHNEYVKGKNLPPAGRRRRRRWGDLNYGGRLEVHEEVITAAPGGAQSD
ncbi:hypothetical protein MTO96_048435 [Rhipicephalus appendiculatus]